MKFVLNVGDTAEGLDGTIYGKGDIVYADGKFVERYLIVFTNGHVHGGDKSVIVYLATSKDDAAHAWRMRETAGTL